MPQVKEVGEVYKCEICGNVVEVKEAGGVYSVDCDDENNEDLKTALEYA